MGELVESCQCVYYAVNFYIMFSLGKFLFLVALAFPFIVYVEGQDWRSDGRCGQRNPLQDGRPGQCDPNANANEQGPCCSSSGWCGNSDAHCKCSGCTDFRTFTPAGPNEFQNIGGFKSALALLRQQQQLNDWRSDGRCGQQYLLQDGRPGQCNPNANANEQGPCCSSSSWCGNSDAHCKCSGCTDF